MFLTRSDTNQAAHLPQMARSLTFGIKKVEGLYFLCSGKKVLINCTVTAQLICTFVFIIKSRFSHDVVDIVSGYTPLHTTVENDDMKAMITLLKNGANIDSQVISVISR